MTFDWCAGLGAFPFRRVPDADAGSLLRLMDAEGLDQALVSALEAVMYRNAQAANELLAERLAPHADRLLGAATVNPAYPRAAEDAALCVHELGMRALRLLPSYHAYRLSDACVLPVMAAAAQLGVPVSVALRVEDERQRHPLLQAPPPAAEDLAGLFRAYPNVQFVLERANAAEVRRVAAQTPDLANWSVEILGKLPLSPESPAQTGVADLLGPDRLLLGTDAPLLYPRVALLRLAALQLDPAAEQRIRWGNAQRLLGRPAAG